MTNIVVAVIVVEIKDGFVGHQVAVVEEQTVETNTVGQFEVLGRVPVILSVKTQLAELHAGGRILLTVITVSEADNLRSGSIDEIVNA